jgi:hypothetical protein
MSDVVRLERLSKSSGHVRGRDLESSLGSSPQQGSAAPPMCVGRVGAMVPADLE